jgi:chaperonin GroEL
MGKGLKIVISSQDEEMVNVKHIKTSTNAREKMAIGIHNLAQVVGSTLGPDGKVVFFERLDPMPPIATKDGVTVAAITHFEDMHENMGADIVKYAARKTAQQAGDGTTTSTIFADYMIQSGLKEVKKGANSRHLGNGIMLAVNQVAKYLDENSVKIGQESPLVKSVAMVSSNYDEAVSDMIAEVIQKIGKDGVITINQSIGTKTSMEYVDGMSVPSGMLHPSFITNYERGVAEYKNVALIISDYEVSQFFEYTAAFGPLHAANNIQRKYNYDNNEEAPYEIKKVDAFLFISKAIIGEALQSLIKSRETKGAPFVAVKPPWTNDLHEILEDIAAMTGGSVVAETKGSSLKEGNPHQYAGWAESIVVSSNGLTIINGAGKKSVIDDRIAYLKNKLEETDASSLRTEYEERIARLQNGIAQITVGGENESIMKEKAYRVEDAKFAVKSALEEGVTVGGGVSFLKALKNIKDLTGANSSETKGINIVKKALEVPIRKILENSGYIKIEQDVIIGNIIGDNSFLTNLKRKVTTLSEAVNDPNDNMGFNARTKIFEDLFAAGVIDPVKVDKVALNEAAYITQQFLNTGAIIGLFDESRQARQGNR